MHERWMRIISHELKLRCRRVIFADLRFKDFEIFLDMNLGNGHHKYLQQVIDEERKGTIDPGSTDKAIEHREARMNQDRPFEELIEDYPELAAENQSNFLRFFT